MEKLDCLFIQKVSQGIKSSEHQSTDGQNHIDEFVMERHERGKIGMSYKSGQKKVICAVQIRDKGNIERKYTVKIDNPSC